MKLYFFRFNSFEVNTIIVADESKQCIIIDPACYSSQEENFFISKINELNLIPKLILNTHCHPDHILGVNFLKNKFNIPFYASQKDIGILNNSVFSASSFGWSISQPQIDVDTSCLDQIEFGETVLQIIPSPGHTPGQQTIASQKQKFLIVGDTIFKDSIGRTDLPGGDLDTLMDTIRNVILKFPDDYTIFPGHGQQTTVGIEKKYNQFLVD